MTSASELIDASLSALRGAEGDKTLAKWLDRLGNTLVATPEAGPELAAMVGRGEDNTAERLLEAALDAARMARENQQADGAAFLDAVDAWLARRDAAGALDVGARLALGRAFVRAGLPAPAPLVIDPDQPGLAAKAALPEAFRSVEAALAALARDLGAEPLALHLALAEMLAVMPPPMRDFMIGRMAGHADPALVDATVYWLVDRDPALRRAAAEALARRAAAGTLPPAAAARLTLVRPWLPADAARDTLDDAIRAARRAGGPAAPAGAPWRLGDVVVSLPDGAGAQSVVASATRGKRRVLAMVLLKLEHGVKDAYLMPLKSRAEAERMLDAIAEETGAEDVPHDYLAAALAEAIGEGLAAGLPPAPGLIDVAEVCGLGALPPQARSLEATLAGLDPDFDVTRLSPVERFGMLEESAEFELPESWFEDSDAVRAILARPGTAPARRKAILAALEARRGWWAHLLTRAAALMAAASDPDWALVAVTAHGLTTGAELGKLPIMRAIAEATVAAGTPEEPVPLRPPAPERKGELAKLIKGSGLLPDWIDGYLMAAAVAPKLVGPGEWVGDLLEEFGGAMDRAKAQRFLDIVTRRYNELAVPPDAARIGAVLAGRKPQAVVDWLDGFAAFTERFAGAWKPAQLPQADRALLKMIRGVRPGRTGDLATIEKLLPEWLARRFAARK
jgi:Uncharacterised protein family (UPF0149)